MSEFVVPKGWENSTIKSISNAVTKGTTPTSLGHNFQYSGVPFLRAENIFLNQLKLNNTKFISKETHDLLNRSKINSGDVLITIAGTIGRATFVPENTPEMNSNQAVAIIKLKETCLPQYLSYFLNSNNAKMQISGSKVTTSISNLSLEMIKNFKVPLPSLSIQKQIVAKLDHILGQLEEKKKQILTIIENNKQRIDFFEKNWLSYVIDREIEHHPERKNWESFPLKEITTSIGDGLHSTPKYTDSSNYYFINGNNLQNGSIVITSKTKMVNRDEYEKYKLELDENTVLLSINGTIGNLSFYRNENVILGKSACYINCKDSLIPEFLFYLLKSNYIKNYFTSELTKTSIPNLSLKSIRKTIVFLPDISTQKQIIKNIKSAEEKFQSQKQQFQNIRDSYESTIKYIEHMQSSILDTAFSGKLLQ